MTMGLCHIVLAIGIAPLVDTLSTGIFAESDATSSHLTLSFVFGNNITQEYVIKALGFDKLSPTALEANKNGKTFLVYWLLMHDNSLNAEYLSTKNIVKKLKELENLSPSNQTKMKSKDSLDTAQLKTKVLFMKLLELEDLQRAQLVASDKYQTYKYLYGLIKQEKIDEYKSKLLKRLTPRL
ncbi:LOW QUALITY PROTEIN: hypothetical protein PHMEG_00030782 [Phytophthora megakarya]|uniref:RxLR effector protein n=1 Tax=Phytophthora megakarya TaxID=4795 RepID=A0A225UZG2_9STRA|nr:LOW QUALITY PROTEIN: hypothetical protein PHMEG_00030782 [Phytophthora megakarya]